MPGPLEEQLKLSRYVSNVMLHGMNRPYNVALVAIDSEAVAAWAAEQGLHLTDPCRDPRVEQLILSELRRLSTSFRSYEVPRRVHLIADDFSTDNDMLTPTLKLKRRNVEQRYGDTLFALYAQPPAQEVSAGREPASARPRP